jgi:hypothetical protein
MAYSDTLCTRSGLQETLTETMDKFAGQTPGYPMPKSIFY